MLLKSKSINPIMNQQLRIIKFIKMKNSHHQFRPMYDSVCMDGYNDILHVATCCVIEGIGWHFWETMDSKYERRFLTFLCFVHD